MATVMLWKSRSYSQFSPSLETVRATSFALRALPKFRRLIPILFRKPFSENLMSIEPPVVSDHVGNNFPPLLYQRLRFRRATKCRLLTVGAAHRLYGPFIEVFPRIGRLD